MIEWQINCSGYCNIYLVDFENLKLIQNGESFTYYYRVDNTLESKDSYSNEEIIKKTLYIVGLNPSKTSTIFISFIRMEYIALMISYDWIVAFIVILLILSLCTIFVSSLFFCLIYFIVNKLTKKTKKIDEEGDYIPQDDPVWIHDY
jgi:hypothetical protein